MDTLQQHETPQHKHCLHLAAVSAALGKERRLKLPAALLAPFQVQHYSHWWDEFYKVWTSDEFQDVLIKIGVKTKHILSILSPASRNPHGEDVMTSGDTRRQTIMHNAIWMSAMSICLARTKARKV